MLEETLRKIAEPALGEVLAHPFWTGLADGSLPPAALARFVAQDTSHLLPAYARALARTAAADPSDAHTMVMGRSTFATLEARDRLITAYADLSDDLGLEPLYSHRSATASTRAHCATFTAASAVSWVAGLGALLPMVWFNHRVSDWLLAEHVPGSRYEPWIRMYHPGEGYQYAVRAFLGMANELDETADPLQRDELVEHFADASEYEPAFADTAWSAVAETQERTSE